MVLLLVAAAADDDDDAGADDDGAVVVSAAAAAPASAAAMALTSLLEARSSSMKAVRPSVFLTIAACSRERCRNCQKTRHDQWQGGRLNIPTVPLQPTRTHIPLTTRALAFNEHKGAREARTPNTHSHTSTWILAWSFRRSRLSLVNTTSLYPRACSSRKRTWLAVAGVADRDGCCCCMLLLLLLLLCFVVVVVVLLLCCCCCCCCCVVVVVVVVVGSGGGGVVLLLGVLVAVGVR